MGTDDRKYYTAYEERYKTAHAQGVSWASSVSTPIVMEVIDKYGISHSQRLLEIGCGEGRDSRTVLEHGFQLTATDISSEAIAYRKCRNMKINSACWTAFPTNWTKNSIFSLPSLLSICLCLTRTETAFMGSSAAI